MIVKWIDTGLTSGYQPGTYLLAKHLKDSIRASYYNHLSAHLSSNFIADQSLVTSCKDLVKFVEKGFRHINDQQS